MFFYRLGEEKHDLMEKIYLVGESCSGTGLVGQQVVIGLRGLRMAAKSKQVAAVVVGLTV